MKLFLNEDFESEFEEEDDVDIVGLLEDCCEAKSETTFDLALRQMRNFFRDKEMYCGGPIPEITFSESNICFVLDMAQRFDIAMKLAYQALRINGEYDSTFNENQIPEDVQLIIKLLRRIEKSGVQKEFVAGVLLIYLEMCEGLEVAK